MNEEFEDFFIHCQKLTSLNGKTSELVLPLKVIFLEQKLKKYLKTILVFSAICSAFYYVDTMNWFFCAVGRLVMIKLLPIWDWRHLEKASCLVAKSETEKLSSGGFTSINERDCLACEHFGEKFSVNTVCGQPKRFFPDLFSFIEIQLSYDLYQQ